MTPFWLGAFLDLAAEDFDRGVAFWRGVTGFGLSAARGRDSEFVTVVPHSMVYQVCLDIPAASYDAEEGFWRTVMGARAEVLPRRPEFSFLRPERQVALDVLAQRLDRPEGAVTAHLDLGTTDRPAETARHVALGAEVLNPEEFWTVLRDPSGLVYCLTDRDPATGRLTG